MVRSCSKLSHYEIDSNKYEFSLKVGIFMAKKKKQQAPVVKNKESETTVADALDNDVLLKLQAEKKELKLVEQANEEKLQAKRRRERQERENNKSFEELLNEFEDIAPKN